MLKATPEEQKMINQLPVGCVVQHYKGHRMKVLAIARHSEDYSLNVVYQKLYNCERFGDQAVVIRPLRMFLEKVKIDRVEIPRFEIIETCAVC